MFTWYIIEFLLMKLDIAQQPAKDGMYLYDKYNDSAPPIEKPATAILPYGIPLETSLLINSCIVLHVESTDSTTSGALIDMLTRSNHTLLN